MNFLPPFRAGTVSCYVKKSPSRNSTDFTYYLSYIIAKKDFVMFFHALRHLLPTSRSNLEGLLSKLVFQK